VSGEELELMRLIDRCHLEHPYYGSRRIRDWLEDEGYRVNRKDNSKDSRFFGDVDRRRIIGKVTGI
jgi:type IV secretory pathway protease TraF